MNMTTSNTLPRRVLNLRAAVILVVVAGAAAVGLRTLHSRQFSRTLDFLRSSAMTLLEKEDFRGAQLQLSQYLAMKPGDLEAQERLSWLLSEKIRTPRSLQQALRLNEELLRKGMTSDDIRLRQAKVAIALNQMSDADAHLKLLQSTQADHAEVWYLSSLTAKARRDVSGAVAALRRSIRCSKTIPEAWVDLARLADDQTPPEFQPDALLTRMIVAEDSVRTRTLRAEYQLEQGHREAALKDLWTAIDQHPDDPTLVPLLVRSLPSLVDSGNETTTAREQLDRGIRYVEKLIDSDERNPALRLAMAELCWRANRRSDAIDTLDAGIQKNPQAFILHQTLIDHLISSRQTERARRLLESIPAGAVRRDQYSYCHGRILMEEKNWTEAIRAFEQALAFSHSDSDIGARAMLSLAICRSQAGDLTQALETFRSVVESQPDSLAGRLGMAAAWVRAGQLELAIAAYQDIIEVPGVAPYLADLMIQRALQQPARVRDWSEVDALLKDEEPVIQDPIQRTLLRADRMFAEGRILEAIAILEKSQLQFPQSAELRAAVGRISGEFSDEICVRLNQLIAEQPGNPEVRAALVRMKLAEHATDDAVAILDQLTSTVQSEISREQSLRLALSTLDLAIAQERHVHRDESIPALQNAARQYAMQLVTLNPEYEPELIRTLVRTGQTEDALARLGQAASAVPHSIRATSWLVAVQCGGQRDEFLPRAMQSVYQLIVQQPSSAELRFVYAELLLYGRQYQSAETTLRSIASISSQTEQVNSRIAWILATENRSLPEAESLITESVSRNPEDAFCREMQARVFLQNRNFEAVVQTLQSIPESRVSPAGRTYHAAALLSLSRRDEARVLLESLSAGRDVGEMLPADEELYRSLVSQLAPQMTKN